MASDIWLRTILIVRKETCCRHIGYSYRLTARVLLYAPSHRQDNTYHGLCYTSRGALAGTRNSSMGPPHEGSIRRPIATMSERSTSELRPAPQLCLNTADKLSPSDEEASHQMTGRRTELFPETEMNDKLKNYSINITQSHLYYNTVKKYTFNFIFSTF